MNAVSPPPAGWYPDPSGRAPFRYWDGARWTEHTDQGTAPSPSLSAPGSAAPSTVPPPPPGGFGGVGAPLPPAAHAAAAPVAGAHDRWTAQTFLADLKRLDGFALVVVGALLFLVCSFLPWTSAEISNQVSTTSDSSNGWDGDGVWLIRGWEVNATNAATQLSGLDVDSGTDMVVLLPIALIGAGVAAASRFGKRVANAKEIVLGAGGLLAILMIAETVHVGGAIDDLVKLLDGQTFTTADGNQFLLSASGSVGFGMYLATLAALVMAGGAVKHFLAARQAAS
mgnify:CR=1 FL=1